MNENHSHAEPNETKLILFFWDYVLNVIFKKSLNKHVESNQRYSTNSEENENIKIIFEKESEKVDLVNNKSKAESAENKCYIRLTAIQNNHKLDYINTNFQERETKYVFDSSKINRAGEISTDFNITSFLNEIIYCIVDQRYHELSGKPILNNDEGKITFSGEKSLILLIPDNVDLKSLGGTKEVHVSVQDSGNISGNRNIYNKPKTEAKIYNSIYIQKISRSMKVQQSKFKNSFSFHPKLIKLDLKTPHQYHSPSIDMRALMPITLVKRSLPSAITRQFEMPRVENFPFSTAGSSLYGSYAYAHTRPSGFGIFPPIGGEGGELGEPIEGGEGVVQPIEGGEEGVE